MGFEARPAPLRLTRETSTNDNVVILRVAIKNKVLIGGVLERNNHTGVLRGEKEKEELQVRGEGKRLGCFPERMGTGHGNAFHMPAPPPGSTVFLICPSASSLIQGYEPSGCSVNACKLTLAKTPRALVTSVSSLRPYGLFN